MTLRPPRDDEFDAMLELMNAHQLAAFGEADVTAEELRSWLTAPSVVIERDIRVLERDGRLIGYADVDGTREDPPLWWCDVKVAPDAAADEVVPELVAWLDERAARGRLRVWTSEQDARIVDAFATLGFAPVRHSYRMEIDLAGDEREPTWPDGISVRTATEADHRLVYDTVIEVWQDTNDTYDETFEEWAHWLVESPSYDPTIWFLAFADDELAGFSICRQDPVDPDAGYVAMLGVRRALAASGSRRGAAPAVLRGVPPARPDARNPRGRRIERHRCDPAVRARRDERVPQHGVPRAAGSPSRMSFAHRTRTRPARLRRSSARTRPSLSPRSAFAEAGVRPASTSNGTREWPSQTARSSAWPRSRWRTSTPGSSSTDRALRN